MLETGLKEYSEPFERKADLNSGFSFIMPHPVADQAMFFCVLDEGHP